VASSPVLRPAPGNGEPRTGRPPDREWTLKMRHEAREAGCDPYNSVGSGVFKVG
jgi:hypothetical protein